MYGHNISHAHNVTNRRFNPNLQPVKAVIEGVVRKIRACTRCIRSGKVVKPAKRQIPVVKASA
jgi:large subunit ribosomal protein L28